MEYLAIDFETATSAGESACSVALIEVKDGRMVDHHTLLQPPGNKYFWRNIQVHGIRERDTANSPFFPRLWPQLSRLLAGKLVVAHNASFDMNVLKRCLQYYDLQPVEFNFMCTVRLSRKVWPQLPNHKLDTMGRFFDIQFKHHDALEDARLCAQIPLKAMEALGTDTIEDLQAMTGVYSCPFVVI